jgi:alpha-tubulin suppressor-like RCC1 family protein
VCGYYHSMAINEAGKLYCWGRNDSGQLGFTSNSKELTPTLVPGLKDEIILDVACGCYHTLVLTASKNEVYAFGRNCHG